MTAPLSVLVAPRDDNPYQELLYGPLRRAGARVAYLDGPTASQTLNVALMPWVLVARRAQGFQVLHLHWVFQFSLPWAVQQRWSRRLLQWWFFFYLWVASRLGFALVWTAHDLLPHEPVFADDTVARDRLLARADLVIALSPATEAELRRLGARTVRRVPFGPYSTVARSPAACQQARRDLGYADDELVVLHLGKILAYKGADLLLQAVAELPSSMPLRAVVVGSCPDAAHAELLRRLAAQLPGRAVLRLERVSDQDMGRYLLAADVAAFPFRAITNSSSVINAQCAGLPVIIPDLRALADIDPDSALRFDGSAAGLAAALQQFAALSRPDRAAMSQRAATAANATDWETVARSTWDAYQVALSARHPN
jgi:glycosyltransferase involved in cell wall biosynthesis